MDIRHIFRTYSGLSGIYKITNLVTDEFYIGATNDICRRWSEHIRSTEGRLHQDIQKYGIQNFLFQVLEPVKVEDLQKREELWIQQLKPEYNKMGSNYSGYKSPEMRKKLSETAKRVHSTPEYRARISAQISRDKRDTVWLNNGIRNRRVKQEDVQDFLRLGYSRGQRRRDDGCLEKHKDLQPSDRGGQTLS